MFSVCTLRFFFNFAMFADVALRPMFFSVVVSTGVICGRYGEALIL